MRIRLNSLWFALAFVATFHCFGQAFAVVSGVELWFVQHRTYEAAEATNVMAFGLLDEFGNYFYSDQSVLNSIQLFDGNNQEVPIKEIQFYAGQEIAGSYDPYTGIFDYGNPLLPSSFYYVLFNSEFLVGTYRVRVQDLDGNFFEDTYDYSGKRILPSIKSDSFKAFFDLDGNLFLTWEVPRDIPLDVSTNVRVDLDSMGANDVWLAALSVKVPTHMSYLYVPQSEIEKLESVGGTLKIRMVVRANDNSNRTYSSYRALEGISPPVNGDFNDDGLVDLQEAIYALQVVSGIR